jgi:curved DNA-binding protein CbpA
MADYYEILEISRAADAVQIKAAYKRLAMLHHPDRNPGNKESEEVFKGINEAYHILSDPLKKSRYDAKHFSYQNIPDSTEAYWRDIRKKQYTAWRQKREYKYTFDKNYFKIQSLAFIVFFVIAGFCFLIIHTTTYFIEKHQARVWLANSQLLKKVDALYLTGNYGEAFRMIDTLHAHNPLEFRFTFRRDSLMGELRNLANGEFKKKNYTIATEYYTFLLANGAAGQWEMLKRLASCEYYMEHYAASLQALKHLHSQQPHDLELIYQIGLINLEKLNNHEEALYYFTLGKKLFKQNLTEIYGKAFEIVMDAADAPDIYYAIFEGRARVNIALKNYREAVTDCNWAIYLRPQLGNPYYLRALATVKSNPSADICGDLSDAERRGILNTKKLRRKYCE